MAAVLGVDGARQGWIGIREVDGRLTALLAPTLTGLVDRAGDVAVIAVDMPVALEVDRDRRCDVEARPLLGPRASSLFPAPPLGALGHADDDYAGANAGAKRVVGKGISKQAWNLVPRIREVRAMAAGGAPVFETMPELSFAAMSGTPLPYSKKTWNGTANRLALLERVGFRPPGDLGPAGAAGADDVVDAAALAWSARRIAEGTAHRVPVDGDGPIIWW